MRHRALRLLLAAGLSTTCPWMIDCVGDDSTPSTSDGGAADNVSPTSDGATSDAAADGLTEAGTSVTGKVVDLSGSPVPNAKVRVGSAPIVTTDANGNYFVPNVPLGTATVARTVRVHDGETIVKEGTYLPEGVSGFLVLEAESLEAAVALAARIPAARLGGAVEVRPVEKYW